MEQINTIEPGDTLWRIAQRHYGNPNLWRRIFHYNIRTIARERNRYGARRELEGPLEHWIFPGTVLELRVRK